MALTSAPPSHLRASVAGMGCELSAPRIGTHSTLGGSVRPMKRRAAVLGVVALVTVLAAGCSSGSSASVPADRRALQHWQSTVNQDQAKLSQDEGCPLNSSVITCTPQTDGDPKVGKDQAKLRSDEAELFAAQRQLQKDEGGG